MDTGEKEIPPWKKYALSITEASQYFNIGEKKMRSIASQNMDSDFIFTNGVKVLIKRKRFEEFLDKTSSI